MNYSSELDNPLLIFKESKSHSWRSLAKQTGISVANIRRIAVKDAHEIQMLPIGTAIKIAKATNVNLINFALGIKPEGK